MQSSESSWLVRISAAFLVLLVALRMLIKFLNLPVHTKPMKGVTFDSVWILLFKRKNYVNP